MGAGAMGRGEKGKVWNRKGERDRKEETRGSNSGKRSIWRKKWSKKEMNRGRKKDGESQIEGGRVEGHKKRARTLFSPQEIKEEIKKRKQEDSARL